MPAVSDSEGARHQQAEREQPQPQQQVAAPPAQPAAPELPQEKLTFANGMNDRLYEQLSAKLMPVDDSSRVLTVSATNTGPLLSNRAGSVRNSSIMSSERQHRVSRSADPSPRCARAWGLNLSWCGTCKNVGRELGIMGCLQLITLCWAPCNPH